MSSEALVQGGNAFVNSAVVGGQWAGKRLLKALAEGRELSPAELRSCDTLRRDEWIEIDTTVVEEAGLRLRGVADLIGAGLTRPIPNAMGKTLLEYSGIGDMDDAVVSMDGLARSDNDRVEFGANNVPLPITHKDFNIGIRTLAASRSGGRSSSTVREGLDTTQIRISTRKVSEMLERMLFKGGAKFGGSTIYGYTTHPQRNTGGFGTNGNWAQVAKTGDNMLADLLTMKAAMIADGFPGPYWLYSGTDYSVVLDKNFVANYPGSIRDRLLGIDGLTKIEFSDQLAANTLVMVQATPDVIQWGMGEDIQPVQWDIYGGFGIAFKVFAIQIPIIRSTQSGKSGIFHMS
jgi:hypothetical protein